MSAVPKIDFIYINHLYVSTAVFLMMSTLYTQSSTKERRGETGQLTQNWKNEMRGVFNKGSGYSLYEHAVMHISVWTEASDNCIHRIEYLNKYKK